jgi:hypothetical protein
MYLRPDGTRAILYLRLSTTAVACAVISSSDAWLADFAVNSNAPAGATSDGFAAMEPSGRLHVFFTVVTTAPFTQCYQAVNLDNSLGTFFAFPITFNVLYFGTPAVVGNSIVVPTTEGDQPGPPPTFNPATGTVWVGTPLNAPVFVESGEIFPNAYAQDWSQDETSAPILLFDGVTLRCLAVLGVRVLPFDYILQVSSTRNLTAPATGWSDSFFYAAPASASFYGSLIRPTLGVA